MQTLRSKRAGREPPPPRPSWAWVVAFLFFVMSEFPGPAAAQAAGGEDWAAPDEAGDVSPLEPGLAPLPPNPLTATVDLVELRIEHEDELAFELFLHVDGAWSQTVGSCCTVAIRYTTRFKLDVSPVEYEVRLTAYGKTLPDASNPSALLGVGPVTAQFCLRPVGGLCESRGSLEAWFDDERDGFGVRVPKERLLASSQPLPPWQQPVAGLPSTLRVGDAAVEFRVEAEQRLVGPPTSGPDLAGGPPDASFHDALPDSGVVATPYVFRHPAANTAIRVAAAGAGASLPVVPGASQPVTLTVTNLAATKRIVQLRYGVESPDGPPSGYNATGPGALTVPGGQSRNVTLALTVPAGAARADQARLVVRGTSLIFAGEVGVVEVRLAPGLVLRPGEEDLRFHARPEPVMGGPADEVLCRLPRIGDCKRGFLSSRADDPEAAAGARVGFVATHDGSAFGFLAEVPSLDGLALPASMDPARPVEFELELAAAAEATGLDLEATLSYAPPAYDWFGNLLARATAQATVGPTPSTVRMSANVLAGEPGRPLVLPAGTKVEVRLRATTAAPGGVVDWAASGLELLPAGSRVVVPVGVPPPDLVSSGASPFQLAALQGADDLVNPGEARLFNVSVLHQGTSAERVRLGVGLENATGWSADVLPGREYDLEPGDTITVGVLVRAPASASEGETAHLRLLATALDGSTASLRLTLVVVGLDLRDDAGAFEADADARGRLVDGDLGQRTSAAALVGLLAALGVALRLARPARP